MLFYVMIYDGLTGNMCDSFKKVCVKSNNGGKIRSLFIIFEKYLYLKYVKKYFY